MFSHPCSSCAFMYPEPPSDQSHPWLWNNFARDDGEVALLLEDGGERTGGGGGGRGGGEKVPTFGSRLQRRASCSAGGEVQVLREEEEQEGRAKMFCWNVTEEARRWFEPYVYNLMKVCLVSFVSLASSSPSPSFPYPPPLL
eukprot:756459-Hanusia_phi.AAC.1